MFSLILLVVLAIAVLVVPVVVGVKTGRLRWLLPTAAVAVALVAWFGWSALGDTVKWDSATAVSDRVLTISYSGSECEDHHSASVHEGDDKVKVTVKTWEFSTGCSDVGASRKITVTLDRALGDRQLIDGSCHSSRKSCAREVVAAR